MHSSSSVPPFVELSARSGFSLLDGACNPEDYAERATELGLPALALTDTFDLGGAVRFTRACEETGVRPIIGAEVRIEFGALRLVLLCENTEGYHHLATLVNEARLAGDRGFPRLDLGHLRRDPEGLVCLLMADAANPEVPGVAAALPPLRDLFGARLHVALEHHGLPADGRRCGRWIEFASARGIPWVPVNAPRYAGLNDWYLARQLKHFKSGVRGSHPQDYYGKQMGFMGRILRDEQAINDVVAYINTLGAETEADVASAEY